MDRRKFLVGSATSVMGVMTGCTSGDLPDNDTEVDDNATTPVEPSTDTNSDNVSTVAGIDLPVPKNKLERGTPKDAIPAITDPVFADDWSGLELVISVQLGQGKERIQPRLNPEDLVIGIARGDSARAYPLRVLNWHEIVNDTFERPLLVTYCPLCGSAITATRRVNGGATNFGISGLLWNSNLVMYDELTGSLWSQIAATAIHGSKTGERLSLVPSTFTTWETWQQSHPETKVLLPPPKSNTVQGEVTRNYTRNPYAGYKNSTQIGLGNNDVPQSEMDLHPKTRVLGITSDGIQKAYPLPAVRTAGVVNDTVGKLPVVVTVAADNTTLMGFVRRVNGELLHFEKASDTHLRAGNSRWKITTGQAIDGPYKGTTLERASDKPQMMWFAWRDFHPDTNVFTTQ